MTRPQKRLIQLIVAWMTVQSPVTAAELSFSPMAGSRLQASVESLFERRWKHVVRQGSDISCGSAALATILKYQFGDRVTEDALIQSILRNVRQEEVRRRGGFSLLDLKRVATGLGYTVKGYKLSVDQLRKLRPPVLVPITIRNFKHFVVVRGIIGERIVLADPSFGNTLLDLSRFEQMWPGIALVIVREGKRRPPAQLKVVRDDLSIVETQEALHSFLNRAAFHTVIGPDEF